MICPDLTAPVYGFFSPDAPSLLYYSHLPAIFTALFFGLFVFFRTKYSLMGKILLSISICFSAWLLLNLVVWTNVESSIIMFAWSLFGIFYVLISALSLYFVYVFVDKKDISFWKKLAILLLVSPVIILSVTDYNISGFNLPLCGCTGFEGELYTNYYYLLGFVFFAWILIVGIRRILKSEKYFRRQIIILLLGIGFFLFSFFITGFLASYLTEKGIISDYGLEFYGIFSVMLFFGLLAYLVVKYNVFNIKLLGTQVLVISIIIMVGAQYAFITTPINKVLNGITVLLVTVFGRFLILSVRKEVRQKEELQSLTLELQKSNIRLQELDRQKTEFLSIASHQLRTPLSIIKGYIELIEDGAFGKPTKKMSDTLHDMDESNERLIKLVDEFLNISRIEQGRTKYVYEYFDVNEIIESTMKELHSKAEDKGLKLSFKPITSLEKIYLDEEKIRNVIFNFIDNAIKYSNEGTVAVSLEKENEGVSVRVKDNGFGFGKEDEANFFQKFYRGKNVIGTNVNGTGLGLFVCRKFIETHGGHVWAHSEGLGKGSEFGFWIPKKAIPFVVAEETTSEQPNTAS